MPFGKVGERKQYLIGAVEQAKWGCGGGIVATD
jgi:hypothetical protein